jgi:hypothetical protein
MNDILNQLLALVEKIPAAFWGMVIGSFFSLGGIVIVNRLLNKRHFLQTSIYDDSLETFSG